MSNDRDDKTDTKAVTDAKDEGVVEGANSTDVSTDAKGTDSALPKGKAAGITTGDGKEAAKSVRQAPPAETPVVEDPLDWARDIFSDIHRTEARVEQAALQTDTARQRAARNDDDLDFEPLDDATASAVRALYELGDETPVEIARSAKPSRDVPSAIPLTDSDPRFEIDHEAELEAATQAMVLNMGAAADTAVAATNEAYPKLPRLHQLCWIGLSGIDQVMRRAAAADVARALPDLADECLTWMESVRATEAEKLGLTLAARIDHRAFASGDPSLFLLATGVLMASLQAPLLRHVVVDHGSTDEGLASKYSTFDSAVPFARSETPAFGASAPASLETLQTLRLLDAGITPLPLGERRISVTEPARRVAAALRDGIETWSDVPIAVRSRLEQVIIGVGMLLTGATRYQSEHETSLLRVAIGHAQVIIAGTVNEAGKTFTDAMEKRRREHTEQLKSERAERSQIERNLDIAIAALADLGRDIEGRLINVPEADSATDPSEDSYHELIVCPAVPNAKSNKVKDVIIGHEHMLGNPVELVPTLHLPRRRAALMEEFPYATDVIDFILGDLVNRATVTIRPVLLTGTPGSGKTHFARRFAHHFGLHVWSVDCSSADGTVFAGTDRRWYSAEPSHPFLAMSQGRQANPLVILDELEKAPTRQDYGRMWDGLLPFLDPGSNKAVQDKALQVAVDCSHINYIATANRLDPLPWPLRDRLRMIEFPEPTAIHLDALIPPLLAELAATRSLDPRFIEPLTEEDHAFLARHWKGGSVRRLARLLEAIINARERAMRQH